MTITDERLREIEAMTKKYPNPYAPDEAPDLIAALRSERARAEKAEAEVERLRDGLMSIRQHETSNPHSFSGSFARSLLAEGEAG